MVGIGTLIGAVIASLMIGAMVGVMMIALCVANGRENNESEWYSGSENKSQSISKDPINR